MDESVGGGLDKWDHNITSSIVAFHKKPPVLPFKLNPTPSSFTLFHPSPPPLLWPSASSGWWFWGINLCHTLKYSEAAHCWFLTGKCHRSRVVKEEGENIVFGVLQSSRSSNNNKSLMGRRDNKMGTIFWVSSDFMWIPQFWFHFDFYGKTNSGQAITKGCGGWWLVKWLSNE